MRACSSTVLVLAGTERAAYADQRRWHCAIAEHLEALDEVAHRLSYALLTDTPFSNCLTTMTVRDPDPNQAELAWSATFQSDGLPVSEAQEMLEGVFKSNSRALQHFLASASP